METLRRCSGWSLIHLHDFNGTDGAYGGYGLIMDSSGALYGVASGGGTSTKCSGGCGVIFELENKSGTWMETDLHNFVNSDGAYPNAPLFMDAAGNLFGTTISGGASGFGVVFEAFPRSGGGFGLHVLHAFSGTHLDGEYPNSAMVMDSAGNLYGTTTFGGAGHSECTSGSTYTGCGTVFELSSVQGRWSESILKAFSGGKDGGFPQGVVMDTAGNLFGAATSGGRLFDGVIFELSP